MKTRFIIILFLVNSLHAQIPVAVDPGLSCLDSSVIAFGQFLANSDPSRQIVFTLDGNYGTFIQYSINNVSGWTTNTQLTGLAQGYYNCKVKVEVDGQTYTKQVKIWPKSLINNYTNQSEYGCETGKITSNINPNIGLRYSINNEVSWSVGNVLAGLTSVRNFIIFK